MQEIFFRILNNDKMSFSEYKFIWKSYTRIKVLLITKKVELIDNKNLPMRY